MLNRRQESTIAQHRWVRRTTRHGARASKERPIRAVALLFLFAVAGCHGASDTNTASAPETPQLSYAQHCLGCHGQRGEGAFGPNIQGLNRTVDQIVTVITTGQGKMPPFGGHLSTAEMRRLAEYVKTFKYKP